MKKLFALALVVLLSATVAFAQAPTTGMSVTNPNGQFSALAVCQHTIDLDETDVFLGTYVIYDYTYDFASTAGAPPTVGGELAMDASTTPYLMYKVTYGGGLYYDIYDDTPQGGTNGMITDGTHGVDLDYAWSVGTTEVAGGYQVLLWDNYKFADNDDACDEEAYIYCYPKALYMNSSVPHNTTLTWSITLRIDLVGSTSV